MFEQEEWITLNFPNRKLQTEGHRVGASALAQTMGYSLAQTKSTVPEQLERGQEAILLCKL